MPSRRQFLAAALATGLGGCSQLSGGDATTTRPTSGPLSLSTTAFSDGGTIPAKYTADGADVSPPLSIAGVPDGTVTLALIADDPDAPGGTFVHWLLWNVPADTSSIPADVPQTKRVSSLGGARQGTNGFGSIGYRGPKPPKNDGAHTYRFTLHAVDETLDVEAGAKRSALSSGLDGHVLATARITGEYDR